MAHAPYGRSSLTGRKCCGGSHQAFCAGTGATDSSALVEKARFNTCKPGQSPTSPTGRLRLPAAPRTAPSSARSPWTTRPQRQSVCGTYFRTTPKRRNTGLVEANSGAALSLPQVALCCRGHSSVLSCRQPRCHHPRFLCRIRDDGARRHASQPGRQRPAPVHLHYKQRGVPGRRRRTPHTRASAWGSRVGAVGDL